MHTLELRTYFGWAKGGPGLRLIPRTYNVELLIGRCATSHRDCRAIMKNGTTRGGAAGAMITATRARQEPARISLMRAEAEGSSRRPVVGCLRRSRTRRSINTDGERRAGE